jgi:hypothetical protein
MLISELTRELATLKRAHGDLEVSFIHRAGELEMTVQEIAYQTKGPLIDAPSVHRQDQLPERVLVELKQQEPHDGESKAVC